MDALFLVGMPKGRGVQESNSGSAAESYSDS